MILTSDFIQKNPNLTTAYVGVMKLFGQSVEVKPSKPNIHEQIQYAAYFAAKYNVKTNTNFDNNLIKINPEELKDSGFTEEVIFRAFSKNMPELTQLVKKPDLNFSDTVNAVVQEKERYHAVGVKTKEWSGIQILPKNKR